MSVLFSSNTSFNDHLKIGHPQALQKRSLLRKSREDRPHDIRLSADTQPIEQDSQSACSVYSFSQTTSPVVSSAHHHTLYYFNSPQQNDPTDYFSPQPIPRKASTPLSYLKRKRDALLRYSTHRLHSSNSSLKSTPSTHLPGRTIRMPNQHLPDFETQVFCPRCEKYVHTRLRYRNGAMVYLVAFVLLLCTVFLFWVPFYVKYFKDVSHYCPGCGKRVGISRRL
ncbi:Lipopolysaccharide-induced tumor necrosis factor-alpha factor [Choanephora cucurbitarum]|uniref:Lipopolysaccharide-induced tumor necrosis factor-alpha factor n=1 Tax=Choanephora cucurbitarum TaxID=101091 RepID=A0A1C7N7E0_9FUNG|nr:Lipopolysaccharide-induced tumor necrosis factor-alpha factor [Choanephora cucurbitarum]